MLKNLFDGNDRFQRWLDDREWLRFLIAIFLAPFLMGGIAHFAEHGHKAIALAVLGGLALFIFARFIAIIRSDWGRRCRTR